MSENICQLCRSPADLQLSHILPAFVFRWLRDTSGTGHIRRSNSPNRRIQDGPKKHLLCRRCEQDIGATETAFASRIFYPYLEDSGRRLPYENWLLKFCTSVSWRTLQWLRHEGALRELTERDDLETSSAEEAWRSYLTGASSHPGVYRQHLIPFDQVEPGPTTRLSPNIHRYLLRALTIDICHGQRNLFVLSKLGRFMILGFIRQTNRSEWSGSQINANSGEVRPRHYTLPIGFLDYMNEKADNMALVTHNMSDRQRARVEEGVLSDIERMRSSDFFAALSADIAMFGSTAFHDNQPLTESASSAARAPARNRDR